MEAAPSFSTAHYLDGGLRVRIHGLTGVPELNGLIATVTQATHGERVPVRVDGDGDRVLSVRPAHLSWVGNDLPIELRCSDGTPSCSMSSANSLLATFSSFTAGVTTLDVFSSFCGLNVQSSPMASPVRSCVVFSG